MNHQTECMEKYAPLLHFITYTGTHGLNASWTEREIVLSNCNNNDVAAYKTTNMHMYKNIFSFCFFFFWFWSQHWCCLHDEFRRVTFRVTIWKGRCIFQSAFFDVCMLCVFGWYFVSFACGASIAYNVIALVAHKKWSHVSQFYVLRYMELAGVWPNYPLTQSVSDS